MWLEIDRNQHRLNCKVREYTSSGLTKHKDMRRSFTTFYAGNLLIPTSSIFELLCCILFQQVRRRREILVKILWSYNQFINLHVTLLLLCFLTPLMSSSPSRFFFWIHQHDSQSTVNLLKSWEIQENAENYFWIRRSFEREDYKSETNWNFLN